MPKLIPPDLDRCQAEKPNGHNFMTLGGSHKMLRCVNVPDFIATEVVPGPDGQIGSMALCHACHVVMQSQIGEGYATFEAIPRLPA